MALVSTTAQDFDQPGTQPGDLVAGIVHSSNCASCHGNFAPDEEPYEMWSGSMMAQSMRDPIFHAAMTIANQDAGGAGNLCMRCHAPGGWLEGRATPADGSAMFGPDYDGVNCNLCHRLVDPIADAANPAEDPAIIAALASAPATSHNGQMIVDPQDRRRGPFDLGPSFFWHEWRESPYHRESLLCSTCHDVSNPAFTRVGGSVPSASDTYVLNTLDTEHPTHDKFDEFPFERTYSEWALSDFADGPIDMQGRFGGNQPLVSSCQDCHMPDTTGNACAIDGPVRSDLPQHPFNGANSWVPLAVYDLDQSLALYTASEASNRPLSVFQAAVDRNISMLERASDLDLTQDVDTLTSRITNQTGHKLPTGYTEGRRMWIHVRFLDAADQIVDEHGEYDAGTADLETADTKVYEAIHGLDAAMAAQAGLAAGPSFHLVLNNMIFKDNRIPPRGFDNADFEAAQAQPVGATYADGQYWDDAEFTIPTAALRAEVEVYHQTTSKEYIEFLRDENSTDGKGQIAYDAWVARGKSAPVLMDAEELDLLPRLEVTPTSAQFNDWITFVTSGGKPGNPAMVFLSAINGFPFFKPLVPGAFNLSGQWTFGGPVPIEPSLPGNSLTFVTFALGPNGNIVQSNPQTVAFF